MPIHGRPSPSFVCRTLIAALALAAATSSAGCGDSTPGESRDTDIDGDVGDGVADTAPPPLLGEPPPHPFLADSPWPTSHQTPYAQGSSPLPGPTHPDGVVEHLNMGLVSVTLTYGAVLDDGRQVIWGSSPAGVYKLLRTPEAWSVVDQQAQAGGLENIIAGAYTVLDRDGVFFRSFGSTIEAWVDDASDPESPIALRDSYEIEGGADVSVIGLSLTWDGRLVFATNDARVGVIGRDFGQPQVVVLADDEAVSNSIAVDETGGIFVVTDRALYRAQWTGERLSVDPADGAWRASYEWGDGEQGSGRLGAGSGSTPSLMGGPDDPDRFVVLTDGRELMHLALFWRDAIPEDAVLVRPDADPRLAAEAPVTFGDPTVTSSASEQSVLVSGYRAVVVSNDYEDASTPIAPVLRGEAPLGVEQFAWEPEARTFETTWVRDDISCPNGIPTMSRATDTMYCIGKQGEVWTLEAFDWATGETRFRVPLGAGQDYNSTYAATEIGADGEIVTGTFTGLVRYRTSGTPEPAGCRDREMTPYPAGSPYLGVHAGPQNNDLVPCDTAGRYTRTWHVLAGFASAQPNTFSPDGQTTYLTTSRPDDAECSVWALDSETGEVRWCADEPGVIGSAVEVDDGGNLYVAGDTSMVSWTSDGTERWRVTFEDEGALGLHLHPSGNIATVTTAGRALMVDRRSGRIRAELDLYDAFELEPPAPGRELDLGAVLPEAILNDFEQIFGDATAFFSLFAGASSGYTDNTIGAAPDGTLYAIGAGRAAGSGALVQILYDDDGLTPGWLMPTHEGSAASPAVSPDGRWVRVSDGNSASALISPASAEARVLIADVEACDSNEDSDPAPEVCEPAVVTPLASGPAMGAAPVLDDAEHYFWEVQLAAFFDHSHPDLVRMRGAERTWASWLPGDAIWTSVITLTDRHIIGTQTTLSRSGESVLGIELPSTAEHALAVVDRETGVLISTVPVPTDSTSTVTVGPDGALYVTMLGLVSGFALDTPIVGGLVRLDPWTRESP